MSPRTLHAPESDQEHDALHDPRLAQIDELIGLCKDRLSGVSNAILSSATKDATLSMYQELRDQAENDASVRSERVSWMRENLHSLKETIIKATRERELFEADVARAVEKGWIHARDVAKWMKTFDDPNLLEMVRSQWVKGEWKTKYQAGWKALADDRTATLQEAAAAGLTDTDIPALATLRENEYFLAKDRTFPERRTLVDETRALIVAVKEQKTTLFRQMHALLHTASTGADLCLHPAKKGAWLRKIMDDPQRYTPDVMRAYMEGWKDARRTYDALSQQYVAAGKPDGCAPMRLSAFLELPYEDGRLVVLREWRNRLAAATTAQTQEQSALDKQKRSIRQSVDLNDLTTATQDLQRLRKEHPDDADVASIAAHIALKESRMAETKKTQETSARTTEALTGLHAILHGLPTALTSHVRYLVENGDTDKITTFFYAMHIRVERGKHGAVTTDDEQDDHGKAEQVEQATVIQERDDTGELTGEAELLINEHTIPEDTIQLLSHHRDRGSIRSPALVVAGVPIEQQAQVVTLGERILQYMYHLRSVGETYHHPATART